MIEPRPSTRAPRHAQPAKINPPPRPGPTSQPRPSRIVLVTGCATPIGHATAARLVQAGWPVYATAHDLEPHALQDLRDLGCRTLALDLSNPASIQAVVSQIERDHGAVGVLVNTIGVDPPEAAARSTPEPEPDPPSPIMPRDPAQLVQHALPAMRNQAWGKIVYVCTDQADAFELEVASDALRAELAGSGVDIISILPGRPQGRDARPCAARLDPEAVARFVQQAVETARPRQRYVVTPTAHRLLRLRRWFSTQA